MSTATTPRKLAAILHADVAGYSRLMGADEEATLRRLTDYRNAMTGCIKRHAGRVVDTAGDSLLAEFSSVVSATDCALELQQLLNSRNAELPPDRRLEFRMGIELADVLHEGDAVYGDGVNVAARIQALAEPGGVCVSDAVRRAVNRRLPVSFESLGEFAVKNIDEPVRAFRVIPQPGWSPSPVDSRPVRRKPLSRIGGAVAAGAILLTLAGVLTVWFLSQQNDTKPTKAAVDKVNATNAARKNAPTSPVEKLSIAVLPFDNIGNDPEQEYFVDGMTEDLITDLSKVAGLFVIARNSTFAYKGKSPGIRRVVEELGVRFVLEGSVRRSGDQVRINAQLIDGRTGGHIWADRYDGKLNDVFGLQDQVTRKIVTVLAVQLTAGDQERATHKGTRNAEAYDVFLQGWQHYLRQTPDDFRKAVAQFKKAVELDPDYGRAYAALAATYWETWKRFWHEALGLAASTHEPRFQAEQFLAKAMQNPTPLAHQVASEMFLHMQQYEEAVAEAQHAIALGPSDADSYIALAGALSVAGKPKEALGWVERAMRLNPHYPPYYLYQLGLAQFGMEQFDQAAVSLERATTLNPDDRWSYRLLIATYGLLGRSKDATRALKAIEERGERGRVNAVDPLTIRTSAFWLPFKTKEDARRLAQGLRQAGIPD